MQGRKSYTEKLFPGFQLSDRISKENLYRRLRETLDKERFSQWLRRNSPTESISCSETTSATATLVLRDSSKVYFFT